MNIRFSNHLYSAVAKSLNSSKCILYTKKESVKKTLTFAVGRWNMLLVPDTQKVAFQDCR